MASNAGSDNWYTEPFLRSSQERKYAITNINSREGAGIPRSTGNRVVHRPSNISNLDRWAMSNFNESFDGKLTYKEVLFSPRTSRVSPRKYDRDRVEFEPGITRKSKEQSPRKSNKEKESTKETPHAPVHEKLYHGEIKQMRPSQIRYTNDLILAHFQDGTPIFATFKDILFGRVQIKQGGVPPIEVMKNENLYWVVNGNRRLYVFKNLEKCGAISLMPVLERRYDTVEIDKHFSTRNSGRSVAVLNDIHIEKKMEEQVKYWREWKEKGDKEIKKAQEVETHKKRKEPAKNGCCVII
ncbi:hypothetical protein CHS0354_021363 [Potamilus streckersoni]|uniref:Uncharacterized protein n=1 Tax=Potamilus streckersoni TaxID=2493646 RepID=A0AAE0S3V0_9BIVA|nr:hypothetical protein CHS0354_021363 [Potamilus streckersoni]